MVEGEQRGPTREPAPGSRPPNVDYESQDLERSTYITAIVHLYRGEVARANTWRNRLDQTTHWAVFATATGLAFAFGDRDASHFSLQFGNVILFILLNLEARRFRFFDVWRSRIRKIETNFFAPILERDLVSPERRWAHLVASDLAEPHFHVTRLQALRLRLVRNYLAIYAVVFAAWILKLALHPAPANSFDELVERCRLGSVPAWAPLSLVAAFYLMLVVILIVGRTPVRPSGQDNWDIGEIVKEETRLGSPGGDWLSQRRETPS